jgi:hypothetical protein
MVQLTMHFVTAFTLPIVKEDENLLHRLLTAYLFVSSFPLCPSQCYPLWHISQIVRSLFISELDGRQGTSFFASLIQSHRVLFSF